MAELGNVVSGGLTDLTASKCLKEIICGNVVSLLHLVSFLGLRGGLNVLYGEKILVHFCIPGINLLYRIHIMADDFS